MSPVYLLAYQQKAQYKDISTDTERRAGLTAIAKLRVIGHSAHSEH